MAAHHFDGVPQLWREELVPSHVDVIAGSKDQVIDVPVADFVDHLREFKKWPVVGVALVQPLDASARVAKIAAR